MSRELTDLIAKKFIARRDVKAIQNSRGFYTPHIDREENRLPWTREDLEAHLAGTKTYGHYMLDENSECKLFAFDIDLKKNVVDKDTSEVIWEGSAPVPEHYDDATKFTGEIVRFDPRLAWRDRAHPARTWMKYQFHLVAHRLMRAIATELELPSACAYSGAKGLHVYAFTGLIPAVDAREGAQIVMDSLGDLKATRGKNFYEFTNDNPIEGFPNLSIEVFPKQDSLEGKDLGNLMRLPLGRNRKTSDPTFFVDMTSALNELQPVDSMYALTTGSPWRRPGE